MSKALLVQVSTPQKCEDYITVKAVVDGDVFIVKERRDGVISISLNGFSPKKYLNWGYAINSTKSAKKEMLKSVSDVIEEYKAKSKPKTYRVNIAVSFGSFDVEVTTENTDDKKIFDEACEVAASEILSTAKLGCVEDL